jgi:hypothetical protein
MVLHPADRVPDLTAVNAADVVPAKSLGFWPLAALAVAVAATVVWNAFLLWEGAKLVLGWLDLT